MSLPSAGGGGGGSSDSGDDSGNSGRENSDSNDNVYNDGKETDNSGDSGEDDDGNDVSCDSSTNSCLSSCDYSGGQCVGPDEWYCSSCNGGPGCDDGYDISVNKGACEGDYSDGSGGGGASSSVGSCSSDSDCGTDGSCSYKDKCDSSDSYPTYSCDSGYCSAEEDTCSRQVSPDADFTIHQDGGEIIFNASVTSDPQSNEEPSNYEWDFGDGNTATGEKVKHEYNSRGEYTVTLTAKDDCVYEDKKERTFLWIDFRGQEVVESQLTDSNKWDIVYDETKKNRCVYNGENQAEGSQIDIAKDVSNYENGGHSVDKEICVDDDTAVGGEWYDRDNSISINYLKSKTGNQVKEVDCHSNNWGTVLPGCEDRDTDISVEEPDWGPYTEGALDDDYDPSSSTNTSDGSSDGSADINLWGVHNTVQDDSDQWDSGPEDFNSEPHPDKINRWAFTPDLSYSVDNTGQSFPPGNCYPRDGGNRITTTVYNDSTNKSKKAFANSYAGLSSGDGTWKDPDDLDTDKLEFGCDLTGPDLGIGYDTGASTTIKESGIGKEYESDIKFDSLSQNNIDFETPVCGDDEDEYLVKDLGQSEKGSWDQGQIYCAPESMESNCFIDNNGDVVVKNEGAAQQRDELGEDHGRLKNDDSICHNLENPDITMWTDQDYSSETCQENILYGKVGVKWISEGYVEQHPSAVTGGIDDSGNKAFDRIIDDFESRHRYGSLHGQIDGSVNEYGTPAPTGKNVSNAPEDLVTNWTASKGFCGGDDDGEHLISQQCSSTYCDTNRSVIGVSENPEACIFDEEATIYDTNVDERKLFNPGETVTIETIEGNPEISCFGNRWYSEWPVNFAAEKLNVTLGNSKTINLNLVNPRKYRISLEITMENPEENPSAYQFSKFEGQKGKSFQTEVEPQSTKTIPIEVKGGSTELDHGDSGSDLYVRGEGTDSDLFGSDSVSVDITETYNATGRKKQEVSGIDELQLLVLAGLSIATFVLMV